jgi:hypothetical protein
VATKEGTTATRSVCARVAMKCTQESAPLRGAIGSPSVSGSHVEVSVVSASDPALFLSSYKSKTSLFSAFFE